MYKHEHTTIKIQVETDLYDYTMTNALRIKKCYTQRNKKTEPQITECNSITLGGMWQL